MFLADKKQTFGRLISDSFRAFKPLYKKILPIFIVNIVVTYGLAFLTFGKTMGQTISSIQQTAIETSESGNIDTLVDTVQTTVGSPLFIFAFSLLLGLVSLYFSLAMFHRGDGVLSDDTNKIAGAWSAGIKRLLPAIGYIFVVLLIYLALGLAVFLLTFIIGAISKWAVFLLYAIAFAAFVILAVRLFYGYPLIVSRQKGVFSAVGSSFSLTKGYFWKLVGMYIIVLFLPGIAFGILAGLCSAILPAGTVGMIVAVAIGVIQSFVITTLAIGAAYVFLNDSIRAHGEITSEE